MGEGHLNCVQGKSLKGGGNGDLNSGSRLRCEWGKRSGARGSRGLTTPGASSTIAVLPVMGWHAARAEQGNLPHYAGPRSTVKFWN
jgi:hypothetical protein